MNIVKVRKDSIPDTVGAAIAKTMRTLQLDASKGLHVTAIGEKANYQAVNAIYMATRYLENDRPHMKLSACIEPQVEIVDGRDQVVMHYIMGWQQRSKKPPEG